MVASYMRSYEGEKDLASPQHSLRNVGLVLLEDLPTRTSSTLGSQIAAGTLSPLSAKTKTKTQSANDQNPLVLSEPVIFSVWGYSYFLSFILAFWIFYLILPKGVRKHYFGAYPKRYKKVEDGQHSLGHWIYPSEHTSQIVNSDQVPNDVKTNRGAQGPDARGRPISGGGVSLSTKSSSLAQATNSSYTTPSFMRGKDKYYNGAHGSDQENASLDSQLQSRGHRGQPSPEHPSIERIPSNAILSESMRRLKGKGVRLIAHGVKCEPKRVWIKLEEDTFSLTWQTEFPKRVPNQLGEISVVLMKGSIHKIALPNVLYIDVGKRTSALLKPETENVPNSCFFSLLTQNGSLDLQTNSNLERDALVSCFSLILDQVHDQDWRNMYEDGSSVFTSSTVTNKYPSDYVEF